MEAKLTLIRSSPIRLPFGLAVYVAAAHLHMTPEFQASGFSRIVLKEGFNLGAYIFDEVRVGTTFDDIRH